MFKNTYEAFINKILKKHLILTIIIRLFLTGSIAQLGEHLICIQGVESSSLFRSTNYG